MKSYKIVFYVYGIEQNAGVFFDCLCSYKNKKLAEIGKKTISAENTEIPFFVVEII